MKGRNTQGRHRNFVVVNEGGRYEQRQIKREQGSYKITRDKITALKELGTKLQLSKNVQKCFVQFGKDHVRPPISVNSIKQQLERQMGRGSFQRAFAWFSMMAAEPQRKSSHFNNRFTCALAGMVVCRVCIGNG